jgi:hypothetical protein
MDLQRLLGDKEQTASREEQCAKEGLTRYTGQVWNIGADVSGVFCLGIESSDGNYL